MRCSVIAYFSFYLCDADLFNNLGNYYVVRKVFTCRCTESKGLKGICINI